MIEWYTGEIIDAKNPIKSNDPVAQSDRAPAF